MGNLRGECAEWSVHGWEDAQCLRPKPKKDGRHVFYAIVQPGSRRQPPFLDDETDEFGEELPRATDENGAVSSGDHNESTGGGTVCGSSAAPRDSGGNESPGGPLAVSNNSGVDESSGGLVAASNNSGVDESSGGPPHTRQQSSGGVIATSTSSGVNESSSGLSAASTDSGADESSSSPVSAHENAVITGAHGLTTRAEIRKYLVVKRERARTALSNTASFFTRGEVIEISDEEDGGRRRQNPWSLREETVLASDVAESFI